MTRGGDSDHDHGDTDYKQPGAIWGHVVIMKVGGWGLTTPNGFDSGYSRLHALNACADDAHRVRWILDVPDTTAGDGYSIGAPTVTGGIVYVTTSSGHVIAIADTKVRHWTGHRCTDEFITPASSGPGWKAVCRAQGFKVVPSPKVLADVPLPDGSDAANLRNEPALADGRVYVGTSGGHVYALWPQ
jgi:outer membrane protein assembly factor BamB